MAPLVDIKYRGEIEKARKEIQELILKEKLNALNLLRLAYASQFSIANSHHDAAGTTTTSSTDAATRKATRSAYNNNLKTAIENIKFEHPTITYPDIYQLAGVVAVETLDGPIIEFVPGRKDSSISPDEGCLPDGKQTPSDLRDVFQRVEISDPKHIVALCGGLKLVRSGVQGPRTEDLKFDNSYFVELVKEKGSSPTDKALLDDPEFRSCVQFYATNKEAFLRDYEEAHKKFSELGLPHSTFFRLILEKNTSVLKDMNVTQRAVGVAVAAAVVILSVFYLINRRRAKHLPQQFP